MIIKRGDISDYVKQWQSFLLIQGFSEVTADGDFGPTTEAATKGFQKMCVLREDGIVGDMTISQAVARGFAGFDAPPITEKVVATPAPSDSVLFPGSNTERLNAAALAKVAPILQKRGARFIAEASLIGLQLRIVQGLRTFAEQDDLYAQGRSKPGKIVTNARGGQSLHNYGLAFDLAPIIDGKVSWDEAKFRVYGDLAFKVGLEWGGSWKRFKDLPHVQCTLGYSLSRIQNLYRIGGLAAVWKSINDE